MNETSASRTGPDVRQLGDTNLPESPFPRGDGQEFRVSLTPEVHKEVWSHGTEDTRVEICGVLVGTWARDRDGPFVQVTASIRGEAAQNKFAEVTFTHETWGRINSEMDKKFADLAIVGWYHTHPDFGIFLSDRDRFIHEHFFSGAGQIALVVDPIRRTEGVFTWRSGKAAMSPYYWVGDRVVLGTAAGEETERPSATSSADPASARPIAAPAAEPSLLPSLSQVLAYLALFLLGYLISGFGSTWQQVRLTEGVVAHYGIWQGLRPELHENLGKLQAKIGEVSQRIAALSADQEKQLAASKSKDAAAQLREWRDVRADFPLIADFVRKLDEAYSPSPEEAEATRRLIVEKLRALDEQSKGILTDPPPDKPKAKATEEKSPKAAKSSK